MQINESSGNVFADLEMSNPAERMTRAKLMTFLCDHIKAEGWTPAEASVQFGVSAERIAYLLAGRFTLFNLVELETLASRVILTTEGDQR